MSQIRLKVLLVKRWPTCTSTYQFCNTCTTQHNQERDFCLQHQGRWKKLNCSCGRSSMYSWHLLTESTQQSWRGCSSYVRNCAETSQHVTLLIHVELFVDRTCAYTQHVTSERFMGSCVVSTTAKSRSWKFRLTWARPLLHHLNQLHCVSWTL